MATNHGKSLEGIEGKPCHCERRVSGITEQHSCLCHSASGLALAGHWMLQADHITAHILERKPDLLWPGSFVPEGLFCFFLPRSYVCLQCSLKYFNVLLVFCSAFPKAAFPTIITSSTFHNAFNLGLNCQKKRYFCKTALSEKKKKKVAAFFVSTCSMLLLTRTDKNSSHWL